MNELINNEDTKAKCCYLKKWTCKLTLRQVFICLSYIFPLSWHTVYVHVLIHTGKGGGRWIREKVRGATIHKVGSKIPRRLIISPVYKSDKHLPQSPCTGQFFRWRHFALVYLYGSSLVNVLSLLTNYHSLFNVPVHFLNGCFLMSRWRVDMALLST